MKDEGSLKRSRAPSDSHSPSIDTHTRTPPDEPRLDMGDLGMFIMRYWERYKEGKEHLRKEIYGGRADERGGYGSLSRHMFNRCPKCKTMKWHFILKDGKRMGECTYCGESWTLE